MPIVVQQVHYEEATVLVWRNIKKFGFIPTGHFGHAAILLRGGSLKKDGYISWWPGEGADKKDALRSQRGVHSKDYESDMVDELSERAQIGLQSGRHNPRPNQHLTEYTDDEDNELWGVEADAKIHVPGLCPKVNFGLNLKRMLKWYKSYRQDHGTYKLASKTKSCAGVAAVALVEGGGEAFHSAPSALIYLEPKQVEKYAIELENAIIDFDTRFTKFEENIDKYLKQQRKVFIFENDLWSVKTWKEQSKIKSVIRSSLIKQVDEGLEEYHKYQWAKTGGGNDDFKKKYKAYISVLDALMKHRTDKPDSERALAVAQLGKQACMVFNQGMIR